MSDAQQQRQPSNRILQALPHEDRERLAPRFETVALSLSEVLFWPGDTIRHVYFPTTSIVSLLAELEDGSGVEVGLVGLEGMVGISAVLGGAETKVATVQGSGEALRMKAEAVREEFGRGGEFQRLLLRYTHALMMQISQSVVCNVRHNISGRLARWILMYHDRIGRDDFFLTQEFMANMLGVRRAGVSEAAERLQQMGMIQYQRGNITMLDRERLEQYACECYPVVKQKYDDFAL